MCTQDEEFVEESVNTRPYSLYMYAYTYIHIRIYKLPHLQDEEEVVQYATAFRIYTYMRVRIHIYSCPTCKTRKSSWNTPTSRAVGIPV